MKDIPFIMNLTSGSIAAAASATDTKNLGSNEEFEVHELRITAADGIFGLQITDQSGVSYQDEEVYFERTGNNRDVHRLPLHLNMAPNETYKFKITNRHTATQTIRLQLIGIKKNV